MKTVAHCATPFLPETGSWIYSQLASLQSYRAVALTQEARNLEQYPVAAVFTAESFGFVKSAANRLIRRITGQYPFYQGVLRAHQADLIHAHHGFQGVRCLGARRRSALPMVTSFYGADATQAARNPKWRALFQRLFHEGELFLAEGSSMAAQLGRIGCPEEKVAVHHLGVDLARIPFDPQAAGEQTRVLICASFREKKGIPDGIGALARARERSGADVRLVLVGDGPERPAVEEALAATGIGRCTERLGFLPYSRLLEELGRCHILLQPSRTAADGDGEGGAPVILLEAQAAGMPVVATRHADIPEYVVDETSGLLAGEGDVEGLADRLVALLENPSRWPAMGRAGRAHVENQYNASRQTRALESIYDTLA